MRVKAVALSAVALLGTLAWPCAGPSETPHWSIAKVDFDPYGSGGFLSPANDSRANRSRSASSRMVNSISRQQSPMSRITWEW